VLLFSIKEEPAVSFPVFLVVALALFIAIDLVLVESMMWRLILAAIVVLAWIFGGAAIGIAVASILSIGIIIKSKIPTISKY
jgi:hypothetical protein